MREFLVHEGLSDAEEETLMANAARCLGPNKRAKMVNLGVPVKAVTYANPDGTVGPSPKGGPPILCISHYNSGGAELLADDYRSHLGANLYRYDSTECPLPPPRETVPHGTDQ